MIPTRKVSLCDFPEPPQLTSEKHNVINRINADEDYEKKDYFNSAVKYIESDEKFEIICLKYLMKNQIDALKYYLELFIYVSTDSDNSLI